MGSLTTGFARVILKVEVRKCDSMKRERGDAVPIIGEDY